MAKELVSDALWAACRPLIPPHRPHAKGGAAWSDDRDCLRGILFVLRTGCQWQALPTEAFGVSGSTCWRRLRDWQAAGVWAAIHARVLASLEAAGGVDHSIGVVDSQSVRAVFGGRTPGPARRTAASAGASGTWSSTRRARRSPCT